MTRVTATEGRRQLFKLLDAVERGEEVVLERAGVRFRLTLEGSRPPRDIPSSPVVVLDEDVLDGEWTWASDEQGQLSFSPRESRS